MAATHIRWIAQEVRGATEQEATGKFSIYERKMEGKYGPRLGELISIPGAGRFLRLECGAFDTIAEAEKALAAAPRFDGYRSIHNY